jgi:hypothetical protein
MSTYQVRLFVPKGCFTAYVSGMTVVDDKLTLLQITRTYTIHTVGAS